MNQMNKVKSSFLVCFFMLGLLVSCAFAQQQPAKINVLIVDGFSNHNWQQTTLMIKNFLDKSQLFNVDVSTAPSEAGSPEWENWNPQFKKYDVVIQNTNNVNKKEIRWPEKVEKNLEKYVKAGGGLYLLHSANNAFDQWDEYNLMLGMGWRKPDQGVAVQIGSNGEIVEIPVGEGKATNHGPRLDVVIQVLTDHPINKDFPSAWKTPDMELYKFLRGPAKNMTILSYGVEEETNIRWPVEWVVAYGKGRVYSSSMGHLWKDDTYPLGYQCAGFQTLVVRVSEWLATGEVTSKVPDDFPTESKTSLRDKP